MCLAVLWLAAPATAFGAADIGGLAGCKEVRRKAPAWETCLPLAPDIVARHRAGEVIERFTSCPPDGVTDAEAVARLEEWLRGRPFNIRYSAVANMSGGLSVLYPCNGRPGSAAE